MRMSLGYGTNLRLETGTIPWMNIVSVLGEELDQVPLGIDEFHNLLSSAQSVRSK